MEDISEAVNVEGSPSSVSDSYAIHRQSESRYAIEPYARLAIFRATPEEKMQLMDIFKNNKAGSLIELTQLRQQWERFIKTASDPRFLTNELGLVREKQREADGQELVRQLEVLIHRLSNKDRASMLTVIDGWLPIELRQEQLVKADAEAQATLDAEQKVQARETKEHFAAQERAREELQALRYWRVRGKGNEKK